MTLSVLGARVVGAALASPQWPCRPRGCESCGCVQREARAVRGRRAMLPCLCVCLGCGKLQGIATDLPYQAVLPIAGCWALLRPFLVSTVCSLHGLPRR